MVIDSFDLNPFLLSHILTNIFTYSNYVDVVYCNEGFIFKTS